MLVGLALAVLPASGAAQAELRATFRVVERAEQPALLASGASGDAGVAAHVPAGWAVSVNRGDAGGRPAAELSSGGGTRVAVTAGRASRVGSPREDSAETVTWTFVPI
jgi:hypothetical protein